jgi:hypothetical protein
MRGNLKLTCGNGFRKALRLHDPVERRKGYPAREAGRFCFMQKKFCRPDFELLQGINMGRIQGKVNYRLFMLT